MTPSYYGSLQQEFDLKATAALLTDQLIAKEKSYKGSWQKRGGPGAFMMLARKADRILPIIDAIKSTWEDIELVSKMENYDIFKAWETLEAMSDSEMNDIEDLAGYLLHVINEMRTVHPRRVEANVQAISKEFREFVLNDDNFETPLIDLPAEDCCCPSITEAVITIEEEEPEQEFTLTLTGEDGSHFRTVGRAKLSEVSKALALSPAYALPIPTPPTAIPSNDEEKSTVDPSTWEASHPHNYPSAGNQCPQCNATSPKSTGNLCTCRMCGHEFPKKVGPSAFDEKFPQSMTEHRHKNQPENSDIVKG